MERNLEIAKIAHSQAQSGLAGQETSLNSIQQRAATNVAIVGLVASLFTVNTIDMVGCVVVNTILVFTAIAFIVSICASLWVLRSRSSWIFHHSASTIVENYINNNPQLSLVEVYVSLARFMEENFTSNDYKLKSMYRTLNVAFAGTTIHIVSWIVVYIFLNWSV